MSYVKALKCRECGQEYEKTAKYVCEFCFGPLEAAYDYDKIKKDISREKIASRSLNIWRYRELLPVEGEKYNTLQEGYTPLIRADRLGAKLGLKNLYVKNDCANPTHSFKDRVVAVASTRALELGFDTLACASTGNLANAVAAYGARAGLKRYVFIPSDLEKGKIIGALVYDPNLIAVNGKKASFLAGGQFPFPIVQPGAGFTAVTISFKEFGVKLEFTPVIMPNGNIHLTVAPEVSTLDFADALTISGFTVPALSTRKAETEFELRDGQSFIIAGLIDNRVTDIWNKVPGLGDIPILGAFFKSKSIQKSNSELMVLCTVHRISPNTEAPAGPKNPQPYMDKDRFDGTKSGKPGEK